jgi:uncharacterized protein
VRRFLLAFLSGALFGAGLLISGMTRPSKVLAFLDVTGAWDPSLAMVMGVAIAVYAAATRLAAARGAPLHAARFDVPPRRDIDRSLLAGAAMFGVGWGLAGFCPGPGLVSAASGYLPALVFVATMTAGMLIHERSSGTPLAR